MAKQKDYFSMDNNINNKENVTNVFVAELERNLFHLSPSPLFIVSFFLNVLWRRVGWDTQISSY